MDENHNQESERQNDSLPADSPQESPTYDNSQDQQEISVEEHLKAPSIKEARGLLATNEVKQSDNIEHFYQGETWEGRSQQVQAQQQSDTNRWWGDASTFRSTKETSGTDTHPQVKGKLGGCLVVWMAFVIVVNVINIIATMALYEQLGTVSVVVALITSPVIIIGAIAVYNFKKWGAIIVGCGLGLGLLFNLLSPNLVGIVVGCIAIPLFIYLIKQKWHHFE